MAPNEAGARNPSQGRVRLDITPEKGREFLHRLGNDDEFRSSLERDPASILRSYGIDLPEEHLTAPVKLPSKEEVQGAVASAQQGTPEKVSSGTHPAIRATINSLTELSACFFIG